MTIKSGIGFPSYRSQVTWSSPQTFNANYPLANVGDMINLRRIASIDAVNTFAIGGVLPAQNPIQFLALAHHNAPADATIRVRLFDNNDPFPSGGGFFHKILDTGDLPVFPGKSAAAGLPNVRPVLLGGTLMAQSFSITLTCATPQTWDIGAVEVSGWWSWADMRDDRSVGVDSRSVVSAMAGNVDYVATQWSPRVLSGHRDFLNIDAEVEQTALDFQRQHATWNPFVYVDDAGDEMSWPRLAFVARNNALPPPKVDNVGSGSFAFDLIEYLG